MSIKKITATLAWLRVPGGLLVSSHLLMLRFSVEIVQPRKFEVGISHNSAKELPSKEAVAGLVKEQSGEVDKIVEELSTSSST